MRSELDIRQRHESELILWAGFESKMGEAARACWERIRILEWTLSDPTEVKTEPPTEPDPPKRANGSSDKLLAVVPDDDEGGDDE